MKNRTIMLGLLLAVVAGSGAFARAEPPTVPAQALQGAGAAVGGPEQATHQTVFAPAHEGAQAAGGFETGKTRLRDIVQVIGPPNASPGDDGKSTACYRYAGWPTVPESFIRIVGPTSSGEADLTCCFSFTSSGVLDGVAAKLNQSNSALVAVAKEDAKAGRTITCPPRLMQPGTVVHLPFVGSR